MILNFTCSNVRSIRDSVTLNLRASTDDTFENNLIYFDGERINPACAIYGSNATGKTSVLTSMYNNMNTAINDTRLHIVADSGTDSILHRKTDDLKKMFFEGNNINDEVQSGIAGDSTVSTFEFDFGMNTEKINMGLEIKDK